MTATAPHLREDLLTPRFYTTDLAKAARTDLQEQRPAFEAMLQEMETDYNRDHFDRKAPLDRLRDLDPEQKAAYESYLVRSCVSEFSGFLLFKELSRQLIKAGRAELGRLFSLMARDEARHGDIFNVLIRCWPALRRGLRGQAFPVVFALEDERWFELRDRMVALHRQLGEGGPAGVVSWLGRLGLRIRFAALLLRQFSQPMVASEANP